MGASIPATFGSFDTWADVLAHVRAGLAVYYQAPMDYRPVKIRARALGNHKIRVYPPSSDVDVFTADSGHLPRFRRQLQAPEV